MDTNTKQGTREKRVCVECGLISYPGGIALHQKASGHKGYVSEATWKAAIEQADDVEKEVKMENCKDILEELNKDWQRRLDFATRHLDSKIMEAHAEVSQVRQEEQKMHDAWCKLNKENKELKKMVASLYILLGLTVAAAIVFLIVVVVAA